MRKTYGGLCLALLGLWLVWAGLARAGAAPVLAVDEDLESLTQGKQGAKVDLGDGVTLRIVQGKWAMQQNLVVFDRGRKILKLEGGKFIEAARLDAGPVRYWLVSAYSGGAHCCGVYYFFSRPQPGQPLRYLGETPGHNGGPLKLRKAVLFRQGLIYLTAFDNRFDYFHESHAGSMLVNVPRVFYLLSPESLRLDNSAFKEVYLKAAAGVNREIMKETSHRRGRPEAILGKGFGGGFEGLNFSDSLGQLLVKRTILYLYAREDARAWQSLKAGVRKYYRTARWLPELRREILAKMQESPY
jgi:hypothetical protein